MNSVKKGVAAAFMVVTAALSLYACGGENPTATPVQTTATTVSAPAPADTTVAAAPTDTAVVSVAPTNTTAARGEATATSGSTSGSTGGSNTGDALSLLQQTNTAMKSVKSYHIVLKSSAAGISTSGEGDVVVPDKVRLNVTTAAGSEQVLVVGGNTYVQIPGSDIYTQIAGSGNVASSATDAIGLAGLAQNATVVGDETLDGVDTTHVKFSYDLDKAVDEAAQAAGTPVTTPSTGLGSADADVWVEKSTGYMHRIMTNSTIAGTATSTTITLSKFNEDVTPPIEAPTNAPQIPSLPSVVAP